MILSYLILGLALTQYQNCAPSNEALEQDLDAPVDVIDQVSVGEISFPQTKVSAFMNDAVTVNGVCGQSGALIAWKLFDSNDQLIERGLAECELGAFSVSLSNQWHNYCGEVLNLEAALGADAFSQTSIESNCN